jgi:hypothetical protein
MTIRSTSAGTNDDIGFILNGDMNSNYSRIYFAGTGTSPSTGNNPSLAMGIHSYPPGAGGPANAWNANVSHFFGYSNPNRHKLVIGREATSVGCVYYLNTWRSNSPINSINLTSTTTQPIAAGSTFRLYGIK